MPVPPVVMMTCVRASASRAHLGGHLRRFVFHQRVAGHLVAGLFEKLPDGEAAGIRVRRPGVAHRQHVARHRRRRVRLVLDVAHAAIIGLDDVPRPSVQGWLTM